MKTVGWIAFVVVAVAMAAGTVLYGQAAGGAAPGAPGTPGTRPERGAGAAAMERERIMAQLEALGLSDKEMAAAEKAVEAKLKARQDLQAELAKLRQISENTAATDQQLGEAIAAYTRALERYRATIQAEDTALAKQLSPKSHAKALVAGLIDNGLSSGRGMRMPGGRAGGAGMPGRRPGGAGAPGGEPGGPPQ